MSRRRKPHGVRSRSRSKPNLAYSLAGCAASSAAAELSVDRDFVVQRIRGVPEGFPRFGFGVAKWRGGFAEVVVSELDGEIAIELVAAEVPPRRVRFVAAVHARAGVLEVGLADRATDIKRAVALRGGGAGEGERGRKTGDRQYCFDGFHNALLVQVEVKLRIGTSGNCLVPEFERGITVVTPRPRRTQHTARGTHKAARPRLWVGFRTCGAGRGLAGSRSRATGAAS